MLPRRSLPRQSSGEPCTQSQNPDRSSRLRWQSGGELDTIICVAEREDGKEAASAIRGKLSVSLRDDMAYVRGRCVAVPTRVCSVVEGFDLVAHGRHAPFLGSLSLAVGSVRGALAISETLAWRTWRRRVHGNAAYK